MDLMTMDRFKGFNFFGCRYMMPIFLVAGMITCNVPSVSSQEKPEPPSCLELTQPKNKVELQELLACIRQVSREREAQRKTVVSQKSLEGSQKLSDALRANSGTGTLQKSANRKQVGKYPESAALTERIIRADPSLSVVTGTQPKAGWLRKKGEQAYSGSVQLTKRIKKELQINNRGQSTQSLVEMNPELKGPITYSESVILTESLKRSMSDQRKRE